MCIFSLSKFGQVEVVAAAIIEEYPNYLHHYRELVVLIICTIMFVLGLPCVTQVSMTYMVVEVKNVWYKSKNMLKNEGTAKC